MKTNCFHFLYCFCILFVASSFNGPALPPYPVTHTAYFPYVTSDADFNSAIKVHHNSEYLMEREADYRTPDGMIDLTHTMTLLPHESRELILSPFARSRQLSAGTDRYGLRLRSHLEIRGNDNGGALAQQAEKYATPGVSWFYHPGVTDFGAGDVRSPIMTTNPWYPGGYLFEDRILGSRML